MPRVATTSPSVVSAARGAQVFARGFAFTRSQAHPCVADRVGRLWVIRDAPRRNGDYRREEWIAVDVAPAEVDRIARDGTRGRFCICAIRPADEPDEDLRSAYRALGYRLGTTEPLMVHDLRRVPRLPSPVPVRRVRTLAQLDRVGKAAGRAQASREQFDADPPLVRQYAAWRDDGTPVGWAQSVVVGRFTWCSNVFVAPDHRRRGIGRALVAKLLADDRRSGARASVLLASHTGAKLYESLGYRHIGELLLYTPGRR